MGRVMCKINSVIPAKAGISCLTRFTIRHEAPASAGAAEELA